MNTHTYAYEYICACMTLSTRWSTDTETHNLWTNMHTHTYTHVYKCMHIHIHTHMHIHTYIHVRTHTHIHRCPATAHHTITTAQRPDNTRSAALVRSQSPQFMAISCRWSQRWSPETRLHFCHFRGLFILISPFPRTDTTVDLKPPSGIPPFRNQNHNGLGRQGLPSVRDVLRARTRISDSVIKMLYKLYGMCSLQKFYDGFCNIVLTHVKGGWTPVAYMSVNIVCQGGGGSIPCHPGFFLSLSFFLKWLIFTSFYSFVRNFTG